MSATHIERVIEANRAALLALPGVVGVAQGICDGAPCIRVFVGSRGAPWQAHIPQQIDEFPVRIDFTEEFKARGDGL